MANVVNYLSFLATAGVASATTAISCKEILLLKNDGTVPIEFNFDNQVASGNQITLNTGEEMSNLAIDATNMYYMASANCVFRFLGLKRLI